jgi:hypothetical protein
VPEHAPELLDEISAMFVQTAASFVHADGRIVLHDAAASTLFFSDRPDRVVGHVDTAWFVGAWHEGGNSFAAVPPNAVLSFGGADGTRPSDVVVVLREPALAGSSLSYEVAVLAGELPPEAGSCVLFIDRSHGPAPANAARDARHRRREGHAPLAALSPRGTL